MDGFLLHKYLVYLRSFFLSWPGVLGCLYLFALLPACLLARLLSARHVVSLHLFCLPILCHTVWFTCTRQVERQAGSLAHVGTMREGRQCSTD